MNKTIAKKIVKLIGYTLLAGLLVLLFKIFLPRNYNAPQVNKREGTKYWDLISGSRIGYTLISGKGEKKTCPIIYLHGGPGGPVSDEHIHILSPFSEDGYDVYLYDQVGCGQSNLLDNIEEYTADRHKKDLEEICKKIGAKKFILIGQSWGAMLATLFAADNPEKIEKIIFTGPGPILPRKTGLADIAPPESLCLKKPLLSNQEANARVQNIRNVAVDLFAKKFGCKLVGDQEANDFYWTQTNQTNKAMVCDTTKCLRAEPGMGYYAFVMTAKSFDKVEDTRPKLKNNEIQVLILKGQCDNQVWGIIPEYLQLFKNHELAIVPNAGHGIWIEQPDIYIKTIKNFLAK